jgi:histidine ammonia-lyase
MRGATPSPVSAAVIRTLREVVPGPGPDRYLAVDIQAALDAVVSGALLDASGIGAER